MSLTGRILLCLCSLLYGVGAFGASGAEYYKAEYIAQIKPDAGVIVLDIHLKGARLPSRVRLSIDSKRHRNFRSTDPIDVQAREVVWRPQGKASRLSYE